MEIPFVVIFIHILFLKNKSLQAKNSQGNVIVKLSMNHAEIAPSLPENITAEQNRKKATKTKR